MNNNDGTITLNINDFMADGLSVFGRDHRRVGSVVAYEPSLGYMQIRPHALTERVFHVPFRTVTHIDPREVFAPTSRRARMRKF